MRARPDRWLWGVLPAAALGVAVASLSPWPESALKPRADAALRGADRTGWATVAVSGRDLVLSGEAPTPEARGAALSVLRAISGARRVVDRAEVAQPRIAPAPAAAWSASRQGDRLLLSGAVPSGHRDAVALRAQAVAPGLRVEDGASAVPGPGPEGFGEAATAALRLLEFLDPGTVTLADGTLTVEGVAPTADAFEAVSAGLRTLPAGLRANAAAVLPPVVSPFTWSVRRSGDAIAVAGHAPDMAARGRVAARARRIDPSARLSLDLRVARGLPPGLDYDAATALLLSQLPAVGEGELGLRDDVLRVTGATPDKDGVARVTAALQRGLPPGFRLGDVRLATVRPQPYRFEARRVPGRLVLAGHLPDEAARENLRALVRQRFFAEAVDDRIRLADGAPAGFAAGAGAALEHLSRLAEGEANLRDTALALSGEALYEQTAERMPADLRAALPPGFTAQAEIRVRRSGSKREAAQP